MSIKSSTSFHSVDFQPTFSEFLFSPWSSRMVTTHIPGFLLHRPQPKLDVVGEQQRCPRDPRSDGLRHCRPQGDPDALQGRPPATRRAVSFFYFGFFIRSNPNLYISFHPINFAVIDWFIHSERQPAVLLTRLPAFNQEILAVIHSFSFQHASWQSVGAAPRPYLGDSDERPHGNAGRKAAGNEPNGHVVQVIRTRWRHQLLIEIVPRFLF